MIHSDFWQNWLYGWIKSREITQVDVVPNGYLFDINDGKRNKELLLVSPDNLEQAVTWLSPKDYLCVSYFEDSLAPPKGWRFALEATMMIHLNLTPQGVNLPPNFVVAHETRPDVFMVKILSPQGELVCSGQIAYYGEYAIFDRIATAPAYQRQGFATQVMALLTLDATSRGIHQGLLCASEQGKGLYHSLGWRSIGRYARFLHQDYTRD
ncbi:hypothetical protein A4G19_03060 [Pasteurellaceae bacterium Macca]|nr:hypothetical protein [Pasteurellaceae bacterium Macca]